MERPHSPVAIWRPRKHTAERTRRSRRTIAFRRKTGDIAAIRRAFQRAQLGRTAALLGKESRLDVVSRVKQRMADAGYANRYAKYLETETIRIVIESKKTAAYR